MKRILLSIFLALISGVLLYGADVITLNDGTKLEGQISDEDADTYTIKIPPAGGGLAIPRIIRKTDVRAVKKAGPDEAAFKDLQDLVPAPDRLTAEQYKERIGRGQAFVARYAQSPHLPAVKAMMKTLEGEHQLAMLGGLKLKGKWIKPADREKDAYEIDASIEVSDLKADLEAGRYHLALRHFENIQSDFSGSEHFTEARNLAMEALAAYRPGVAGDLARVDDRITKRKAELQRLPINQRNAEEAEIAKQDAAYMKRVKAEQTARTKWFSLNPYHKGPLQAVLRNIDSTRKELERPTTEAKLAGPIYREAWDAARSSDYEGGQKLVSELKALRVPERYLTALEEKLTAPESETPKAVTNRPPEPAPEDEPPEEKKPEEEKVSKPVVPEEDPGAPAGPSGEPEKKGFPLQIVLVVVLVAVILVALLAAFGGKKH